MFDGAQIVGAPDVGSVNGQPVDIFDAPPKRLRL